MNAIGGPEAAALGVARERVAHARTQLDRAVDAARKTGASWQDVGDALGISRQAAYKRFGRPINPTTGVEMATRTSTTAELIIRTEEAFQQLATGDYGAVTAAMAPGVAEVLTRQVLLDTWTGVLQETGDLESCEATHLETLDRSVIDDEHPGRGMVIGQTTLRCEAGEWTGRIAFDANDRVVGILIVPVGSRDLAF